MKTGFIVLFIIYLIVLAKVIIFKDAIFFHLVPTNDDYQQKSASKALVSYNLVPFRTIFLYLQESGKETRFFNLYGNIILFIPFGFLLPVVLNKAFYFSRVLFCTLFISIGFEVYQYLTQTGQADIDDVILNTTGGLLGYFFIAVYYRRGTQKQILNAG